MKRVLISTIFVLVYSFTTAQDSFLDPVANANIAESNQQTVTLEDNPESGNIFSLTDKDGNSYSVLRIGNQLWMGENLKTTKFNDGKEIPLVSDYRSWSSLSRPGYCWYNNDVESYRTSYGALYNGYTVSTGKLCPSGWRVPTVEDWMTLTGYLGEKTAGGKLKETSKWMSPNTGATNEVGFKALPGGSRGNLGSFMDEGLRGHWWSSTEYEETNIRNHSMSYSQSNVAASSDNKKSGLSVRCVKDWSSPGMTSSNPGNPEDQVHGENIKPAEDN